MASSFEKSVKGATKVKLAPPKTKYIEHILIATHSGEAGVGEVFRALQYRLSDTAWTTVFKSLITAHLMIREGSPDITLAYLAKHRSLLVATSITDGQIQGRNIRHYANYLNERARAYRDTKIDWVRAKESILEKLTVDKGLLRETEAVQHQVTALLKCDVVEVDAGNDITIFVFRLLVLDLLSLFQVLNQAMINILGHFFEMSKVDAERAMQIYLNFTKQTDYVVQYLTVARQYEPQTRVEVPKLKHAPVNLGRQLEEYLRDPDFEVHRRQYLAELEAKKNPKSSPSDGKASASRSTVPSQVKATTGASATTKSAEPPSASKPVKPKGPDQDLIDFFGSIEQNQTPMLVQPGATPWGVNTTPNGGAGMFAAQPTGMYQQNTFAAQPTGFQPTNPFQMQSTGTAPFVQQQQQPQQQLQQLQPAFTGVGFGGFAQQQPQQIMPQQTAFQPNSLAPIPAATFQPQQLPATSTPGSLAPPQQLLSMPTGQSTNPFRQSMMTAQPTGMNGMGLGATNGMSNMSGINNMATGPPTLSSGPINAGLQAPTASPLVAAQTGSTNPFARPSPSQAVPTSSTDATPAPLVAMRTGTNPFARDYGGAHAALPQRPVTAGGISSQPQSLVSQPTGTTNPFRQAAFVNQQTGLGWQHSQPTGSLIDTLETVPVFPRPAPQSPWQ